VVAVQNLVDEMRKTMVAQFAKEGFTEDQIQFGCEVDMRFLGQASEIRILVEELPLTKQMFGGVEEKFKAEHERLYGHRSDSDNPVEVVAVRLGGRTGAHEGDGALQPAERVDAQIDSSRRAYFGEKWGMLDTPVISRRQLTKPTSGPLLIDEYDSTTVVPPSMRARLDEQGNIVLEANAT
jgi:N-methylhydantoinase A